MIKHEQEPRYSYSTRREQTSWTTSIRLWWIGHTVKLSGVEERLKGKLMNHSENFELVSVPADGEHSWCILRDVAGRVLALSSQIEDPAGPTTLDNVQDCDAERGA